MSCCNASSSSSTSCGTNPVWEPSVEHCYATGSGGGQVEVPASCCNSSSSTSSTSSCTPSYPPPPGYIYNPQTVPAYPTDDRYRDLCVGGTNIDPNKFNAATGELVGASLDESVGAMTGARPPIDAGCLPMKTTPGLSMDAVATSFTNDAQENYNTLPPNALGADFPVNRIFSYLLNFKDLYDYKDPSMFGEGHIRFYKGYNDRTRRNTVLPGGLNYCLETMKLKAPFKNNPQKYPQEVAQFRRAQAYNCAAQFIGMRALMPWQIYEPAGSPLKLYANADKVADEFCQPLKSGYAVDSDATGQGKDYLGMAPVWQSNSPLLNENEYSARWNPATQTFSNYDYTIMSYLRGSLNKVFRGTPPQPAYVVNGEVPYEYNNAIENTVNAWLPEQRPPSATYKPYLYTNLYKPSETAGVFHPARAISMPCVVPYMVDQFNPSTAAPPANDLNPYKTKQAANGSTMVAEKPNAGAWLPKISGINWSIILSDAQANPPDGSGGGFTPQNSPQACDAGPECKPTPLPPLALTWTSFLDPKQESYCPRVERIVDPSHPFSPRHDIIYTDRDLSNSTSYKKDLYCKGNLIAKDVYTYTHYNNPDGWWNQNPQKKPTHPTVQCAVVPVDIPSFRMNDFLGCMQPRIDYNHMAFKNYIIATGSPAGFVPPCSTRYFEYDSPSNCPINYTVQQCCSLITKPVVPLNQLKIRTAEGVTIKPDNQDNNDANSKYKGVFVEKFFLGGISPGLAWDILVGNGTAQSFALKPVTGYNVPPNDDPFLEEAKKYAQQRSMSGAEPAEYRFSNYFAPFVDPIDGKLVGYNMPYMRWWDTGTAAGNPWKLGSFINTLGGWDAIVGVGREGRDAYELKATKARADNNPENSAKKEWTAGAKASLNANHIFGRSNREAGNIGGWGELLLHQMYTQRFHNLNCIGRYERLFKDGDADNYTHYAAGGSFTNQEGRAYPWPLGWRGYAAYFSSVVSFLGPPHSTGLGTGLDFVKPGDIAIFNFNNVAHPMFIENVGFDKAVGQGGGVATYVNGCHRLNGQGDCLQIVRLYVRAWNQGKFPSAAGVTNQWGMGPTRVFFRDVVPETYLLPNQEDLLAAKTPVMKDNKRVGWQPSCSDPDYTVCALPWGQVDWNRTPFYRPSVQPDYVCNYANWPLPSMAGTISSAFFSKCIADGKDAPLPYRSAGGAGAYKGAGTGAITKTSFCSPLWGSCGPNTGEAPAPAPRERN